MNKYVLVLNSHGQIMAKMASKPHSNKLFEYESMADNQMKQQENDRIQLRTTKRCYCYKIWMKNQNRISMKAN